MALYPYVEGNQIEKYIHQFMRVFAGFQVRSGRMVDGDPELKRVWVHYAGMDRMIAALINKNTNRQNVSLPIIAVDLNGLQPDPVRRKSPVHEDEIPINDNEFIRRLVGVPMVMEMEVAIMASSHTELFQLLEQILLIFNPRVSIQRDTDIDQSDYITEISLNTISKEIQSPIGQSRNMYVQVLSFEVPIRLSYPRGVSDDIIKQINQNVTVDENMDNVITEDITDE